jgi:hypothetical protein
LAAGGEQSDWVVGITWTFDSAYLVATSIGFDFELVGIRLPKRCYYSVVALGRNADAATELGIFVVP